MIIVISGKTASGKTTLARALADEFGGTTASFGDYVRALAVSQGLGADRKTLQEIGHAAVTADVSRFVSGFLAGLELGTKAILVLDGLRHVSVRAALCEYARKANVKMRFVHIETDEEQRATRLRARGESDLMTALHDAHPSEADVCSLLRDKADVIVQRDEDASAMVHEIAARLLAAEASRRNTGSQAK